MKSVLTLVVAALLGAAGLWAFQNMEARKARDAAQASHPAAPAEPAGASSPPAAPPPQPAPLIAREPAPQKPLLAKRPIFFDGDARPNEPSPQVGETVTPQESTPAREAEPSAARLVAGSAIEADRALARTAFDSGDKNRGIRLLEDLFHAAKDRPDVDLSPEAMRLLEAEARPERKREYIQYLAKLDRSGRVLDDQLARAAKKTAAADDGPDAALVAWDELSLAYDIAPERTQRKRVMGQVEPFIQRMVFSGRYTPLLKSYTIQPGDNLSSIAAKFQTTQDSMRRINGLKNEVIQPRQRLRILPGKLKIFVDKSDFLLWATLDGRIFLAFPVGIGRDNATPVGAFSVRVRQKDPSWWRPGEQPIPPGDSRNVLGSRWLGFQETQDYAGFGIHGTSDPSSLGKESSAGCIRLRNEDIELLFDFVPYGTEVVIRA